MHPPNRNSHVDWSLKSHTTAKKKTHKNYNLYVQILLHRHCTTGYSPLAQLSHICYTYYTQRFSLPTFTVSSLSPLSSRGLHYKTHVLAQQRYGAILRMLSECALLLNYSNNCVSLFTVKCNCGLNEYINIVFLFIMIMKNIVKISSAQDMQASLFSSFGDWNSVLSTNC